MPDLTALTQDTLEQMRAPMLKAVTTTGFTTGLGLQGYELEAPAKFLFPVLSPFRNWVPRTKAPVGSLNANWKAITAINAGNASPTVGFGVAGPSVTTTEQSYAAAYAAVALGDTVQWDAQMLARGFDDLRARAGTNLLFSLMIAEDKLALGGQNFALQTPGTITLTLSTTGGTIAASTAVHVVVAARTIENYYFQLSNAAGTAAGTAAGGGTVTSADATATTGSGTSTNSFTATVPYVVGAVAYDWYVGATNTAYYYAATTQVNALGVQTTIVGADATLSTLPGVSTFRTGAGANVRTAYVDTSADASSFNGLLPSMVGDIATTGLAVQRSTGTASGASFTSLDNGTLTGANGTVTQIDTALLSIYNTSKVSPTRMLMNAQHHLDVSNKMMSTTNAPINTVVMGADLPGRQDMAMGVFVTKYINKAANGYPIVMETMPNLPPGLIILLTEVLPYPSNQVNSVFEIETQAEYQQIEYAMSRGAGSAGGPRYDVEVRAVETFKNYFPAGCAAIHNIANG